MKIEGTTDLDDYSGLKPSWVQGRAQLDAVEAANIRTAISKYLGRRRFEFPGWFTVEHINRVHVDMFGSVWRWAGKYRHSNKNIGIAAYLVPLEMHKLSLDVHYWAANGWRPLEISARVHHRLAWIHPYENGNGRHARLIGDMILHSVSQPFPKWPILSDSNATRRQYLAALREADQNDFKSLEDFINRCIVATSAPTLPK